MSTRARDFGRVRPSFLSSVARVLFALLVVSAFASPAAAENSDEVVAKMTQLNRDAVTAYEAKKFDDARKILKEALELAEGNGLEQHPITARTHIHMGIVIIGGFKQRELGIKQFKKALEIEPTINLTKALVTPELTEAFNEAKAGGTAPAAPPPPAAAPEPAPAAPEAPSEPAAPPAAEAPAPEGGGAGLTHEQVTEAKQGSAISITVGVPPELKFEKVVLAYRPEGSTEFLGREMKEVAEGRYGAEIPPSATTGNFVAYYIEADDAGGNAIASKGTADAPMTIALSSGGAVIKKKPPEPAPGAEEEEEPDHRYFAALLLGSGFGWATGVGDLNHDVSINPPGMAWAKLGHIAPEVGYWISSSLMLSVQLRYQFITGTTDLYAGNNRVYHAANYAFAAFGKATWRWGADDWHPFFSLAVGGGQIRHVVEFGSRASGCGSNRMQDCVDTIAAGPILFGPGGGISYDLTDRLAFIAQANSVLAFPNFTFNIDLNVGLAMGF